MEALPELVPADSEAEAAPTDMEAEAAEAEAEEPEILSSDADDDGRDDAFDDRREDARRDDAAFRKQMRGDACCAAPPLKLRRPPLQSRDDARPAAAELAHAISSNSEEQDEQDVKDKQDEQGESSGEVKDEQDIKEQQESSDEVKDEQESMESDEEESFEAEPDVDVRLEVASPTSPVPSEMAALPSHMKTEAADEMHAPLMPLHAKARPARRRLPILTPASWSGPPPTLKRPFEERGWWY